MGGKAFGRQAKRMTTQQLQLLKHHCVTALQDIFVGIMPLRHYTKKEIHGDLDLICAWPGIKLGHFTSHGGRGSVDVSVRDITWEWDHVSCESPLREFDGWCGAVAYKVGAVHWTRFNYETPVLSLKVLCELLEKDTHNTDGYDKEGIVEEEDDGAKVGREVRVCTTLIASPFIKSTCSLSLPSHSNLPISWHQADH